MSISRGRLHEEHERIERAKAKCRDLRYTAVWGITVAVPETRNCRHACSMGGRPVGNRDDVIVNECCPLARLRHAAPHDESPRAEFASGPPSVCGCNLYDAVSAFTGRLN